ncbi:myoneurin isoform X1 [Manduca sexta]|uniref:myoneurin isoform X1 n=1 Tax=Manduca sexta TaxID=7130 RepID=UPI00188FE8CB|nr:myoneurin isoform X1 [Manduca sexta]
MEGFCRGCLIKYDNPTALLQYTEKNRRLFVYSTGLQVKRNDAFVFQLCKDCYLSMKLACKFKKLCRSSDKKFKNYLGLQDAGENLDFCTFLKNNDDALTIRFPQIIGNSTPGNQISRDEDNESTCTSIRNFMTDIMQGEEMPDTEARIIREVIEEEADVLDDSLDSHWLQEDASIDTDFRLDFSFSPFSTPRSTHGFTPKKITENKNGEIHYFSTKKLMGKVDNSDKPEKPQNKENESIENKLNILNEDAQDSDKIVKDFFAGDKSLDPIDLDGNLVDIDQNITVDEELYLGTRPQNYYIPTDVEPAPVQLEVDDKKVATEDTSKVQMQCTIDRNLENALKDGDGKEFSLADLLVSPPVVFPEVSAPSTPTITNILFGKKLDIDGGEDTTEIKIGQCIEKYEAIAGDMDMIEEFFNQNDKELEMEKQNDNETKPETELKVKSDQWSVEDKFDIENCICKVCSKNFSSSKALRIHSAKIHKLKISNPDKYAYKHKLRTCDTCGKGFRDDARYYRHKMNHKDDNKTYKCERCLLTFGSQVKLDTHMTSHTGQILKKQHTGKQYVCNICGAVSNHYNNYRIHKLRHTKNYTSTCSECGKGFFRSSDLVSHMRRHTGERPFKCEHCQRAFSRRDALIKHVKLHIDERHFQCHYCDKRFVKKMELKNHILKSKICIRLRNKVAEEEKSKDQSQVDVTYAFVTSS